MWESSDSKKSAWEWTFFRVEVVRRLDEETKAAVYIENTRCRASVPSKTIPVYYLRESTRKQSILSSFTTVFVYYTEFFDKLVSLG